MVAGLDQLPLTRDLNAVPYLRGQGLRRRYDDRGNRRDEQRAAQNTIDLHAHRVASGVIAADAADVVTCARIPWPRVSNREIATRRAVSPGMEQGQLA